MFGSTSSFNIIKNPFSHNVVNKLDKDGWKQLDLKKKIAQLIMVRVNGKFYNSENYYKRNLKKWISEDEIGGVISFSGIIAGLPIQNKYRTIPKIENTSFRLFSSIKTIT